MNAELHMPLYAFDTLAFANKLKKAGLDNNIAEVQAELQAEVLSDIASCGQLATKRDIQELKTELKLEKSELRSELGEVKGKIDKLSGELMVKLGSIIIACTGILGILIAFVTRIH